MLKLEQYKEKYNEYVNEYTKTSKNHRMAEERLSYQDWKYQFDALHGGGLGYKQINKELVDAQRMYSRRQVETIHKAKSKLKEQLNTKLENYAADRAKLINDGLDKDEVISKLNLKYGTTESEIKAQLAELVKSKIDINTNMDEMYALLRSIAGSDTAYDNLLSPKEEQM